MIINLIRKKQRYVVVFIILSVLNHVFAPSAVLALTSGPVSPDFSSFEPVDASDMVNTMTGDLAYTVPLIEVPGPEGGYPLSLSYHAGISPNEDASWVGLGWTLNPGSISRSVRGFPDDWANQNASRRDYWAGGVTNTTSVGVNIPITQLFSVQLGMTYVSDTYQGVGIGLSAGVGIGSSNGLGMSVGISVAPYTGDLALTAGVGMKMPWGGSIGVYGTISGQGSSVGISVSQGILGASLSTNRGFSFSAPGVNGSVSNSKSGLITTRTSSLEINLIFFSFSQQKVRYWSDETEQSKIFGAMYSNQMINIPSSNDVVNDGLAISESGNWGSDPEKDQGGAVPYFDTYTVVSQGLGGVMRPYLFQGSVSRQAKIERESPTARRVTVQYTNMYTNPDFIGFRFEGDFSNSFQQRYPGYEQSSSAITYGAPPFWSDNDQLGYEWPGGYNSTSQELADSKHIAYHVVNSGGSIISPSGQPFIIPRVNGLQRNLHLGANQLRASHITGFSITNESGVTYHYNLPAYSYDEENYQQNKSGTLNFNRQVKSTGYAYIWHLTAVTGPDYVDRGMIGVLDEPDYGYWISFEYGKWSDEYVWRTPASGYSDIEDQNFKTMSIGKKEIYYLNAVKTRTHTAVFEKNVRKDGKSVSKQSYEKQIQNGVETSYKNDGIYNVNSNQSMLLNKIYILNNSDADMIYSSNGGSAGMVPAGRTVDCSQCELTYNVLDKNDIDVAGRSLIESKSLRIIDLNYDYSLAKRALNSFDFNNPSLKDGKLTLRSVAFRGKGGTGYMPPLEFKYELEDDELIKGTGIIASDKITDATVKYEIGDLIETDEPNPVYCGYVAERTARGNVYDYVIKGNPALGNLGNRSIRNTKNPPYNNGYYDMWGMYKSDIITNISDDNLRRETSVVSAKSADVWSLRSIRNALGSVIKIQYEAHSFKKPVFGQYLPLEGFGFQKISANNFLVSISSSQGNIRDYFNVGDRVNAVFLKEMYGFMDAKYHILLPTDELIITAISGPYIYFSLPPEYADFLTSNLPGGNFKPSVIRAVNFSFVPENKDHYGGDGVRVKRITVNDLNGKNSVMEYSYKNADGKSSGSVLYKPLKYSKAFFPEMSNVPKGIIDGFEKMINPWVYKMETFGHELPGPSVLYGRVAMSSSVRYSDGKEYRSPATTVIEYHTFDDIRYSKTVGSPGLSGTDYSVSNLIFQKFVGVPGTVKSISVFDRQNKLLSKTVNHYLHDNIPANDFFTTYRSRLQAYRFQGALTERYSESKTVWNGSRYITKGTMTARENYPIVKLGTTVYDYVNKTIQSDLIKSYDYYSGAVLETVNTDAYGNRFLNKVVPAYHIYPQMGLRQSAPMNKHMLTQVAGNYVYRADASDQANGLVSASVSIWRNDAPVLTNGVYVMQNTLSNGNVWRKASEYNWMPVQKTADGMTAMDNFVPFDYATVNNRHYNWKLTSTILLFDPYSRALLSQDMNLMKAMNRYGYKDSKAVLSGVNTNYLESVFSGAEDETISGSVQQNVLQGEGLVSTLAAHTGNRSLRLASSKSGFVYTVPVSELTAGRDYVASVWVRAVSGTAHDTRLYYQLNGVTRSVSVSSAASTKKAGEWTLVYLDIKGGDIAAGNTLRIACRNDYPADVLADDFRFQPVNATTQAYVYDPFTGELSYVLDNNNLSTGYEYDESGRLKAIYQEQFGRGRWKVKENIINYHK